MEPTDEELEKIFDDAVADEWPRDEPRSYRETFERSDRAGRRALFEAGRASLNLPEVGEPDRSGTYPVWRHDVDCFVELSTDTRDVEPIDVSADAPLSPERARWLAAALLAAADHATRSSAGKGET